MCVCDRVSNKILNAEFKGDKYFVDEVETQLREKPLPGSQTQDIHYSANKAVIDVVFYLPKYINHKITIRNSTNPYRIGLY